MSKKSKPLIWLEYAAAWLLLNLLGALPRATAVRVAMSFARLAYPFLGGLRRVGMRNLEIVFPEMPLADRERMLKASLENLGRILGDVSQFHKYDADDLSRLVEFQFYSPENLRSEEFKRYAEEKAKGRGTIVVSPHLGNWEIVVLGHSAFREPIHYLARPLDNPRIEEMTARLRSRFGNKPINKTNSAASAIAVLRDGGILGMLPDVNAHPKEGVFVPFFGMNACTTAGVAVLALRTNAMILPLCSVWDEKRGKYRAVHGNVIEPARTDDRDRDVVETTAAYTAAMETFVRQFPEQWLWIHKRWKTRPPGEKELY